MKRRPGEVRDAIIEVLRDFPGGARVQQIESGVTALLGTVASSSIRSYLRLNTPTLFARQERAQYVLTGIEDAAQPKSESSQNRLEQFRFGQSVLSLGDCHEWLESRPKNSIHAVVTDPPYGLVEYSPEQQEKLHSGRGGVWRIPPSFDGTVRSPLPRFTVPRTSDLRALEDFFSRWAQLLWPVLVPGANVVIASNPLLSYLVAGAVARAGFERRGEIVRLVRTMRGGDRPKAAHVEFQDVSVLPRSMWEPWLLFRKPVEGRVQDNLRKWKTGGFRRPSRDRPFGDVIVSAPTRPSERALAPHPSLKPQAFMRLLVRGVLPLSEGIVLDPFAGSGSTLAAAEAVGYESIGIESDRRYFGVAKHAIPKLANFKVRPDLVGTPNLNEASRSHHHVG